MKIFLIIVSAFIATFHPYGTYDFVIKNIGLFDGENDLGIVNICINGDSIAAISRESLDSDSIIDGTGKYIIPGLVNGHVHLISTTDLKESYRHGILADLNMHTGLEDRELKWKKISRDSAGYALLYGAGSAATVPGGHPTQLTPHMETINDSVSIQEWVDKRIANGVDYIKIIRENSPYFEFPGLPTLSYEQIKEIIDYAHIE